MTTPTLDQTVAALATTSQALHAAQADFQTKNGLWESALNAMGLLWQRPGRRPTLPPPPTNPDLNALAAAVVAAKTALQAAKTAYDTAKAAHDAALATAGVVTT